MRTRNHWLTKLRTSRSARPFVVVGALVGALAFVACVVLVVAGVVLGALLGGSERTPEQAAAWATATARVEQRLTTTARRATPEPGASVEAAPAENPQSTARPLIPETSQAASEPVDAETLPISETATLSATLPAGEAPPTGGAPESPDPAAPGEASAAGALVQLMSEPGLPGALELTPTTQLTLSSIVFVENAGQFPANVRFQVRGRAGGGLWLATDGLWLTLLEGLPAFGEPPPGEATTPYWQDRDTQRGLALKLSFEGANPNPRIEPFDPLDTQVSFLHGDDPQAWQTGVPAWGGVRYLDLYPDVDLELRGEGEFFRQRLVVHEGANLAGVRLNVEGAGALVLEPVAPSPGTETGQPASYVLRLATALGDVSLPLFEVVWAGAAPDDHPPLPAPQLVGAGTVVDAPFSPPDDAGDEAPFNRLYTALLGSGGNAGSLGIATDPAGQSYVTGFAYSPASLDTPGPFEAASGGDYDAFVLKFGAGGQEMAYLAFLGGSGDEAANAIAVDGAGRATIAGVSASADLPAAPGAYAGGLDGFVARLNPAGDAPDYVTYLGGQAFDRAWSVAVDALGNAYAVGVTDSDDWPATAGSLDETLDGRDAFVAKIDDNGGLAWATFLGGSGDDQALDVAVSGVGNATVVGTTHSPDFPVTAGTLDVKLDGGADAFIAKLDADGAGLAYATFLGGGSDDFGRAVALDAGGRATVVGTTRSPDFPATAGSFDASHGGGSDAFLAAVDATGTGLRYAAFLGDGGDDWGQGVAVDGRGYAYVTGARSAAGSVGAFVARIDEAGARLAHLSDLDAGSPAFGLAVAVDPLGSAYVAGMGRSAGRWQATATKLVMGTPFLDLPLAYTNFARSALGNVGDRGPGRVNTWFDHRYPNHSQNERLTRWDGVEARFTSSSPSRIGESWYDGHGGIDFRRSGWDEPVYAAAPGTVIDTVTACRVGQTACGAYFGNRVWLDHGNGYATVYAHLKSVSVAVGDRVVDPAALSLGIMGNTGRSLGTHLHFAVYFDADHDGRWTSDEVVDPYGWAGTGRDPAGGPGWYLWQQPLSARQLVGGGAVEGDVVLPSPAGYVTATLTAGALAAPALVELWDVPPAGNPQAGWYATGRAFWLRAADDVALVAPIQVSMGYRDKDMVHLDPGRLTLFRWDASRGAWDSLATTVDKEQHRVSTETADLGRFDLHAPLLCPADGQEPDDAYGAAMDLLVSGQPVTRVFDIEADVDWFRFQAQKGQVYVAQIDRLTGGALAVMQLYDADGSTLLASGEAQEGGASFLRWRAPDDGAYLVRVSPMDGSARGCDATYRFRLTRVLPPDEVAIAGPEEGLPGVTYAFTATVSPAAAATPITYTWRVAGQPRLTYAAGLSSTQDLAWSAPGEQQVVVTATNAAGSAVGRFEVVVSAPVKAAFYAAPTTGEAPLAVTFVNTASGSVETVRWDFGDGSSSSIEHPSHTYQAPGEYTVTLTVSGPGGKDTATRVAYVTVTQGQPSVGGGHVVYLPLVVHGR